MRQRTPRRIAMSVLIVALAALLLGCGRRSSEPQSGTGPETMGRGGRASMSTGPTGQSGRGQLAVLGITGRPSQTDPPGLLVTGFLPSSEPWPLEIIGVKVGDVIVMCNGEQEQMGSLLVDALEALQTKGEPISLGVIRSGQRMRLGRTEKIPGPDTDPQPE